MEAPPATVVVLAAVSGATVLAAAGFSALASGLLWLAAPVVARSRLAGGVFGGGFGGGGAAGGAGGGGSSIDDTATDQILVADVCPGNGEVVITAVAPVFAGIPGQANCHGKSVSALDKQYGGLSNAAAALGFDGVKALQEAIGDFCDA